ncbi:unnamed protein product [Brugia timori]|uniref:OPA1_C domain-containing protein n=1 Tax=Brugia timori TaxID=42155 RepID=A0A0R3QUZ0_9BILA|nr:unnamed protein product [Brugia timori]
MRELDRDELFDKARGEILDEIVNLSLVPAKRWEKLLKKRLWDAVAPHIFDQILMPASAVDNAGSFNTLVDIKMKHWADKELAIKSIQSGWEILSELFKKQLEDDAKHRKDEDSEIFDRLKHAVLEAALREHQWDSKAVDYLRVIQLNAMEDRVVPDHRSWNNAIEFMISAIQDRLNETRKQIAEWHGPSFWARWIYWKTPTAENSLAGTIQEELRNLLIQNPEHIQSLLDDDLTILRRNLEAKGLKELSNELIRKQWKLIYREHFLERQYQVSQFHTAIECQDFYPHYKLGFDDTDVDCQGVVLFYRIQKMIDLTCNALRQQITNTEQRRLEKEIKFEKKYQEKCFEKTKSDFQDVLDEWAHDIDKKKEYLTGRRVELAEELKQVRHIQERLEEFIVELQQEKSS